MEAVPLIRDGDGAPAHFESEYTRSKQPAAESGRSSRRTSWWGNAKVDDDDTTGSSRADAAWAVNSAGVPIPGLSSATSLGTFRGVFVPACIGLVGPTLFLRLPYVISQAGLLMTILMVVLVAILSFFILSGSNALLTNGRPVPGGAYLIISRTLGSELGASIGVIMVSEHLLAVNLYLTLCAEILLLTKESEQYENGDDISKADRFKALAIESFLLVFTTCFAGISARSASGATVVMWVIKMAAILVATVAFLASPATPFGPAIDNTTDDDDRINNATFSEFFTGPSLRSLRSNLYPNEDGGNEQLSDNAFQNFLLLFAIVYGPFSGLLCGVNYTGDVGNPGKRFPRGMAYATVMGVALFALFSLVISSCVYKLSDLNSVRGLVPWICPSRWVVVIGMVACCLGTALLHLAAARTAVRGLLDDGLLPGGRALSVWCSLRLPAGCARWELFPLWMLMQLSFLPNTVTKTWTYSTTVTYAILAISVLFITACLNASLLALIAIKPPSFRPVYQGFNKFTAVSGVVVPLLVMFGINHVYSLIFVGTFLFLVIFFTLTAPDTSFGEISTAIIYHQVRKFLFQLSQAKQRSNKFWRPSLLFFDLGLRDPNHLSENELHIITWANEIKKGGLFLIASAALGPFSEASLCMRETLERQWTALIKRTGIKALSVTTVSETLREGFRQATMLTGLGKLKPNTLLIEWLDSTASDFELCGIIRDVRLTELTFLMARNFASIAPANIFNKYEPELEDDELIDQDVVGGAGGAGLELGSISGIGGIARRRGGSGSGGGDGGRASVRLDSTPTLRRGMRLPPPPPLPPPRKRRQALHYVDVLAAPIIFPGSAAAPLEYGWNELGYCISTAIMLVTCLQRRGRWRKNARLRIVTAVGLDADAEPERQRWKAWLLAIRIRGEVLVISYESSLKPHPGSSPLATPLRTNAGSARGEASGGGGGGGDGDYGLEEVDSAAVAAHLTVRLQQAVAPGNGSEGPDPDAPPVLPAAIAPGSPFLTELSREEQVRLLLPHLVEHSKRTAMTFVPICPPPPANTAGDFDAAADLRYRRQMDQFGQALEHPLAFIHASQNVMHVDL